MYDTWLMKATESCWSTSGIYHDWGSFRLDSLEHEDYKYKAQGTATSYIKYLSESPFESYGSYLDSLEVSWDRFYNGLEVYCEQPLLIFVNYGVRIYYPNGSHAEQYVGEYVSLTVTVKGIWNDEYDYESDYTTYYECQAEDGGKVWTFLVRDYRQSDGFNLTVGDVITVYGQGGGNTTIYNYTAGNVTAPCVHMLYLELAVGE